MDLLAVTQSADPPGGFSGWVARDQVLGKGMAEATTLPGVVPLMLETYFNPQAVAHLRTEGAVGISASDVPVSNDHVHGVGLSSPLLAPLPSGAQVAMLAWWPVAAQGATPLPVWSAANTSRPGGSNGYLSWSRLVAVAAGDQVEVPATLAFAGRYRAPERGVSLMDLSHITLSAEQADRWMKTPSGKKLAGMVLGRSLRAGDHLALVAMHLMLGNGDRGFWGTIWWGDDHSGGQPLMAMGQGAGYRFDWTGDAVLPREADGSPNRCFNPWLEGALMDSGEGAGTDANCISCHSRAAFPARGFLQVSRGYRPVEAGVTTTGMLWSLALQASRE